MVDVLEIIKLILTKLVTSNRNKTDADADAKNKNVNSIFIVQVHLLKIANLARLQALLSSTLTQITQMNITRLTETQLAGARPVRLS